jgi:putative hemolysin
VLEPYRHGRTIELLWHGIWTYVLHHRIDAMVGCASLQGTDPIALALPLSFLQHFARAPRRWRVNAVPGRGVEMNLMPKEAIDERTAVRSLPPMIKGYLRLGAGVSEHAVIDHQFGTTDVMVVLRTAAVAHRYVNRHAALDSRIDACGNNAR